MGFWAGVMVESSVHRQREAPAGVWGYYKYWEKADSQGNTRRGWSGTKGLWMTPAWCEVIGVIGVLDLR